MAEVIIASILAPILAGSVLASPSIVTESQGIVAEGEAKKREEEQSAKKRAALLGESNKKKISDATAQRDKDTGAAASNARISGGGRGTILTSPLGVLSDAYGGNTAIGGK